MNILLIRPRPSAETIGLQHVMICEPLELEYLYSNVPDAIKDNCKIEIIDMILEKKEIGHFIKKHKPQIVALTGYITHVNTIKEYCRTIKDISPACTTIVGGVHCEVNPQDFVDENIDYILNANGIDSFNEICTNVFNKNRDFKIEGAYEPGKPAVKKCSFDYKFPDRKSTSKYKDRYYYMFHNPCALIKTSFGCPFSCTFCFCKEITDGKYFSRSISSVIDELKTIDEGEIYIVDDDFLHDKKRLNEFCDRLEEENIRKNYLVYGRADFIAKNEDTISRLSQNGLRAVIVGLESSRKKDLDTYNKKTDVDTNEKAVKILQKYNIELYATLIVPLDFKRSDFKEMCNWLNSLDVTFVNLQPLTPLKGTSIYDSYKKDFIIDENDFEKWDLAHLVLRPMHMSVRMFYFEILKSYYRVVMRPKKTIRLIRKYGLKENIKMLVGSSLVSLQYLKKILRGG